MRSSENGDDSVACAAAAAAEAEASRGRGGKSCEEPEAYYCPSFELRFGFT
jgi:hypothetical protein